MRTRNKSLIWRKIREALTYMSVENVSDGRKKCKNSFGDFVNIHDAQAVGLGKMKKRTMFFFNYPGHH